MYVNDPMILELLALLKAHGVHHIVISPGSRHYPIVRSLENDQDFTLYSVVDERSAGFFAIGVSRAINAPTGILTTSGTAAVNLSSAIADAYYQRLPLVAITADRLPQLLDQMEDQMVNQTQLFPGTIRARADLRPVNGDVDHWYNNRVLNEALLATNVNGTGPVHINVPIEAHHNMTFAVPELPAARVISHHTPTSWGTDWSSVTDRLQGKRVMLLWGQSSPPEKSILDALDFFTAATDSLVVTDHLGNLHQNGVLPKAFRAVRSAKARSGALAPDVVITFGGTLFLIDEIKTLIRGQEVEHWRVDPDGAIVDPFWQLTDVFQCSPRDFLANAVPPDAPASDHAYLKVAHEIAEAVPSPSKAFGELSVIGNVVQELPHGSALHIANSAPMRMSHLFEIDESVTVLGNRGVNGIDGSMSATLGYAAASGSLTYLVIGDLSFFYDMNSLGIRHLPSNLRILVLNNGGGALMQAAPPKSLAAQTSIHTSAAHALTVRGWVESVGMEYIKASDQSSLEAALPAFLGQSSSSAMVLEVFTEHVTDILQLKEFYSSNTAAGGSTYRKARAFAGRQLRRLGVRE